MDDEKDGLRRAASRNVRMYSAKTRPYHPPTSSPLPTFSELFLMENGQKKLMKRAARCCPFPEFLVFPAYLVSSVLLS